MRIEHLAKKREAISEGVRRASGFLIRSWEVISEGERHTPGRTSTMISKNFGASGFFIGSWEAIMVSTEALPN